MNMRRPFGGCGMLEPMLDLILVRKVTTEDGRRLILTSCAGCGKYPRRPNSPCCEGDYFAELRVIVNTGPNKGR